MYTPYRFSWRMLLTIVTIGIWTVPAAAQPGSLFSAPQPGTVSGTGVSSIEKPPEVMQLHVDLLAKAGTLKDAIQALKDRQESARKTLEELGADMDSLSFGDVSVSNAQSQEQQQLSEMMAMIEQQRLQSGRPAPKTSSVPITVTCPLTVEWELDSKSSEELLLFVHPLQEEIRTADLSGAKDASELTAEQKELMEEMQGEYGSTYYSSSGEEEPGTPHFLFTAKISEEEYDRALAEAYRKAKADAARLSKATGSKLGTLVSVTSEATEGATEDYSDYYYQRQFIYRQLQSMSASTSESENQAVGFKPGTVTKQIAVTAWFDFQQ